MHANHEAAVEFLKEAFSTQHSVVSQEADSAPASPLRSDNEPGAAEMDQDCG